MVFLPMDTLYSLFPTADQLLALSPEDLAPVLLSLARARRQGPEMMFEPNSVTQPQSITGEPVGYPFHYKTAVDGLLNEAWNCLRRDVMIVPAPGINGLHGWMVFTRPGEEAAASKEAFERIRAAKAFPKDLLHPTIADKVWSELMRGDLDDAVFHSFKAVEEAVRAAGGYSNSDYGVDLMRKAFNPASGPLSKSTDQLAEREALSHLFAGAIGSYKNPHSHRTVKITDPREAQEQVMLATHLLRIVDARKP
jgi:uncharacterized protein (TIGR02391 family)